MKHSFFISSEPKAIEQFLSTGERQRTTFEGLIFIYTREGEAQIEIDDRLYTLQAKSLLSILPHHVYLIRKRSSLFRTCTFAFTFDFMSDFPFLLSEKISEKIQLLPLVRLTRDEQIRMNDDLNVIQRYYQLTRHPSQREILCSLAFVFTAEVKGIYSRNPIKITTTHCEELTDRFFHLLQKKFHTHREVAYYANKLCITPKYLARIIRQVTGETPTYWIAFFIVREVKALLKSTTLTVTQLSEQFNFPNSSFFAKYFKRQTGISPAAYRKGNNPITRVTNH